MKAWTETPTKWYPLPVAVGAFLLVVMQYRKRRAEREVQVDEQGREILRLKGPWHVSGISSSPQFPRLVFVLYRLCVPKTRSSWRLCYVFDTIPTLCTRCTSYCYFHLFPKDCVLICLDRCTC